MRDPRFAASRASGNERPPPPEELEQARTLAREIALGLPSAESLDRAHEALTHARAERWDAFYDGFAALVRGDEERRRAWVDVLLAEVRRASADPEALLMSRKLDAEAISAQTRTWKEETDPFAVWGPLYKDHVSYREDIPFYHLSLLLLVDPAAWCEAVDRLPWPGAMRMAFFFYTHLQENRDLLEELLRVAPRVFDAQGHWVEPRSVVVLLVAQEIVAHAGALHNAVESRGRAPGRECKETEGDLRTLENQELPEWMRKAFGVLLARADGPSISLGLLSDLARKELLRQEPRPGETWVADQQAFHILAQSLASAGLGVRDARETWTAAVARAEQERARNKARRWIRTSGRQVGEYKGEGARTLSGEGLPLLLGAAVMLGDDPSSQAELDAFWRWFEDLLVGRDPGLSLIEHGSSMVEVPQRFGFLLSRMPNPFARFRATYIKLEPQRRRSLFGHRYEDLDHDLGSVLLLRIGLYAAANWRVREEEAGRDGAPARAFFWDLYEAARRLWLTSIHDFEETKQELVTVCFAFMTALFPENLEDALRRAAPAIAGDARMLSTAGWFLWKNGVAADRLVPLMREVGADLERALRDAHQWAMLAKVRSRRQAVDHQNREFPGSLEELARALGLVLEEEAAEAPPQTERARRRGDLARSIPWGTEFLRRLDADGCSIVRLVPLAAAGASWLLQASLPSALRERFGLAPEVRVLVVHGQVRGRDLRVALQEPKGAADIDPDLIVVANDQPDLARRLPMLAGPWGQRIPWPPEGSHFAALADTLREHLPTVDLFDYRDPVRGNALVGRRDEIDLLAAQLLRGEAVGVVGLRKVGKSSLLRAVAERLDPIGARRGMFESLTVPLPEAEPEALVVSLDVQSVAGSGLPVLVERLSAVLEDRLALAGVIEGAAPPPRDAFTGVQLLQAQSGTRNDGGADLYLRSTLDPIDRMRALLKLALERSALPIVFVLDEYDLLFEGYGGEPGIAGVERLLALLRAEAHATRRVSLALIGRDPSFLDAPLLSGFTNPLAGWAKHMFLGSLREEEAQELLMRLGKRTGLDVGPATLETSWRWTGGHPLLVRQYGAALFELAHAPPTRPRPVPTDPVHQDAVEVFLVRPAVYTICTEVHALLEARYPESLALIEALSQASQAQTGAIVERHGGARSRALHVLSRFGTVGGDPGAPWVPGVFREWFAPSPQENRSPSRSASGEV